MRIYAELPGRRVRQIVSDISVVGWVGLWVWVALQIHDLASTVAEPGKAVQDVGGVVGDLFGGSTGKTVSGIGSYESNLVTQVGFWLAVAVIVFPLTFALLRYVPARVRWVREATAAAALRGTPDSLQLFALRALTSQPLDRLVKRVADPVLTYGRGEYRELAAVELEALGLNFDAGPG